MQLVLDLVQQRVVELAKTAIDYPPMQAPASFNLDAVKAQVEEEIKPRRAIAEFVERGGRWEEAARLLPSLSK